MLARRPLRLVLVLALLPACKDPPTQPTTTSPSAPWSAPIPNPAREPLAAPERTGGALMRSADGARLYLADEDHRCVRVLPLPFGDEPPAPAPAASASASASLPAAPPPASRASAGASASAKPPAAPPPDNGHRNPPPPSARQEEVAMPGAPAQVLPLDGYVLVTIRDPGLLLVLKEEPGNKLKVEARIPIAPDAWGLAVTRDEAVAVVTSAWTHEVTGVDLRARKTLWTLDVAREPRGVVIHPGGKVAYISHLTSGDLTRIDDVASAQARASTVVFPAAPSRTPVATPVPGSLGYALVMDDAGNRLLAARHALGALAWESWYGVSTVDVLQTANDKPLLGPRAPGQPIRSVPAFDEARAGVNKESQDFSHYRVRQFAYPQPAAPGMVQPRAMVVAHRSQTVWLASEGEDRVVELPLLAAAPSESVLRSIEVSRGDKDPKNLGSYGPAIPDACGAPTGLALSRDESLLYVFCRSTYDVATVRLRNAALTVARVAADPLDESGSRGRRFFYNATDSYTSGGMGCAGCHPEGRDDGHVWHDVLDETARKWNGTSSYQDPEAFVFLASKNLVQKTHGGKLGHPRQTPMLAGRVSSSGPYGWHAQNATLLDRLVEGFSRHRWRHTDVKPTHWLTGERVNVLTPFLRKGLVPPPRLERDLTAQEKEGKEIFQSPATQCTRCHDPATELTDRIAYPLPKLAPPAGFEEEEDLKFKTPSLLFVGGTPPYFHDGHAPTLQALVAENHDRMGKTSQLTEGQRAALVAYLETL